MTSLLTNRKMKTIQSTYFMRSETCAMNSEITAASGIAFPEDFLSSSSGNATLGFVPTTATEFDDFSAATLIFTKRVR